jgi:hypothetical protein
MRNMFSDFEKHSFYEFHENITITDVALNDISRKVSSS